MTRRPVTEEIITRVPATLLLTGTSVLVMLSISIPIGILSSFKSLSVINQFGRIFAVVGTSIPGFWLGILLIELFSVRLGWLPSMGTGSIRHLILPSLALGLTMAAVYVRMIRSSMTISMEKSLYGEQEQGAFIVARHA